MVAHVGPQDTEQSDEELLDTFREGRDASAFECLLRRHEPGLLGYLRRLLGGDRHLAEDVVQAAFLQVFLRSDRFESGRRFRPWLYGIATHRAIDVVRRRRRQRFAPRDGGRGVHGWDVVDGLADDGPEAVDLVIDLESREWLQVAVDRLSVVQRGAIRLVYDQGMKYHEAARQLGVPVGTVKSRVHAAIAALITASRQDADRAILPDTSTK